MNSVLAWSEQQGRSKFYISRKNEGTYLKRLKFKISTQMMPFLHSTFYRANPGDNSLRNLLIGGMIAGSSFDRFEMLSDARDGVDSFLNCIVSCR